MLPRPPAISILALGAILATLILAPSASASPAGTAAGGGEESLLFVQQTRGGELERVRRGVFRLRLRGVSARVSTFTDRPRRRAGQQGTRRFVKRWTAYGFAADPPNAALVLDRAPRGRDVAMLTLSHPRYNQRKRTLTYTAKPLRGTSDTSLAGFAERGDPVRPRRFGAADLFIDGGSETIYKSVRLQVSNAQPGQTIVVEATGNGDPIGWSSGPSFNNDAGVEITSLSGELPISQLNLSSSEITVRTTQGGSGSALTFTIGLYLVATPDTETFYLSSSSDPGVEVTAAIGDSIPQVVNQTQTLFSWNPI